jgi:hypothetical protein
VLPRNFYMLLSFSVFVTLFFDHNRIASKDDIPVSHRIREQLNTGVEVDSTYKGPRLEYVEGESGKKEARITKEFVEEMLEYFKAGKTIHRRYAWEIVMGAQKELNKHESLVNVVIPEGETADMWVLFAFVLLFPSWMLTDSYSCSIGDTHGEFTVNRLMGLLPNGLSPCQDNFSTSSTSCPLLGRQVRHTRSFSMATLWTEDRGQQRLS